MAEEIKSDLSADDWTAATAEEEPASPRGAVAPAASAQARVFPELSATGTGSSVGGLDMGFIPGKGGLTAPQMVAKGALDVLFLLGADEIDLSASDAFTVYLGTHGDAGAHKADVNFGTITVTGL